MSNRPTEARWKQAQDEELAGWHDFGSEPRHFTERYWNWELHYFGLNLDWFDQLPANAAMIEIGCGPYGMIHFIRRGRRFGLEPLGHDIRSMVISSRDSVRLIEGRGEHIPCRDGQFDVVIIFNVLDHVESPAAVLSECWRVLKRGGHLIFNVNIIHRIPGMKALMDVVDKPHPHHWTLADLSNLLKANGITTRRVQAQPRRNYRFRLERSGLLPRIVADLRIGDNMYYPAKGSVFHHIGSNILNLRADILAVKE